MSGGCLPENFTLRLPGGENPGSEDRFFHAKIKRGSPRARGRPPTNVSVCFQFIVCVISFVRLIGYLLDSAHMTSEFPGVIFHPGHFCLFVRAPIPVSG